LPSTVRSSFFRSCIKPLAVAIFICPMSAALRSFAFSSSAQRPTDMQWGNSIAGYRTPVEWPKWTAAQGGRESYQNNRIFPSDAALSACLGLGHKWSNRGVPREARRSIAAIGWPARRWNGKHDHPSRKFDKPGASLECRRRSRSI